TNIKRALRLPSVWTTCVRCSCSGQRVQSPISLCICSSVSVPEIRVSAGVTQIDSTPNSRRCSKRFFTDSISSVPIRPEPNDYIQNTICGFTFRHYWQLNRRSVFRNNRDRVRRRIETRIRTRYVVCHYGIEILTSQLDGS